MCGFGVFTENLKSSRMTHTVVTEFYDYSLKRTTNASGILFVKWELVNFGLHSDACNNEMNCIRFLGYKILKKAHQNRNNPRRTN